MFLKARNVLVLVLVVIIGCIAGYVGLVKLQTRVEKPFLVWSAKPLERIYKDTVPEESYINRRIEISCARNEYEGCMFGVYANVDVHSLKLKASDLTYGNYSIPKQNVQLYFVGSIPVSKNTPNTPTEELERVAPFYAPDPLLDVETVNVKSGETQPCYFLVYVPKDAEPGNYTGRIVISSDEGEAFLEVLLHVYPITLPDRRSLYVTNWFSLDNIASFYGVELWSEGFWEVFEKWIALMAEHRQNVFWIPIDTVKVLAENDGYKFDFSIFDRYVELLLKYKADRIEITHIAHFKTWGVRELLFREFDTIHPNGVVKRESGEKVLPLLLPALEKHLEENGWLNMAMIHIADEPTEDGLENWIKASEFVHKYAPRIKRIDAIETVGFNGFLEVWVPTLHHFNDWMDEYIEAMDEHEVWFYTCCNPTGRYPNRFLDFSLLKTRVLHWLNYAYALKGYLHWGFNWWGRDPFGELNPNLPPGDTHIAYPGRNGPLSSLRLEVMRDGLEDYEYLKLLEEEILKVKETLGGRALKEPFERRALEICMRVVPSITGYVRDPDILMEVRRGIVENILEVKSRPLALVLTEPPEWKTIVSGPITVIVKGVCENGSYVEVNGKPVEVRDGYFSTYTYPTRNGEIVVKIMKDGFEKTVKRRFNIVS
ncbi:DUF4091 domain-containing protein [Candidatus Bathyarchaeota archaeon]|nr:DUF4091 domain-containing protein [Candidatus Bathyarchaeota archaeon]